MVLRWSRRTFKYPKAERFVNLKVFLLRFYRHEGNLYKIFSKINQDNYEYR